MLQHHSPPSLSSLPNLLKQQIPVHLYSSYYIERCWIHAACTQSIKLSQIIKHKKEEEKNTHSLTQSVNLINKINFYDRFYYIVSFNQIDQYFFVVAAVPFLNCFSYIEHRSVFFFLTLFISVRSFSLLLLLFSSLPKIIDLFILFKSDC